MLMVDSAIKRNFMWVPINQIDNPDRVMEVLTVHCKYEDNPSVRLCRYSEDMEYMGFPRNISGLEVGDLVDNTVYYKSRNINFKGILRKNQVPLVQIFQEKLEDGVTDMIVNSPPGTGKTVMLLNFIAELNTPTLVVVPKADLVEQWRDRILTFTNIPESKIGYARQKVCDFKDKTVVLGMLQSLYKDRYGQEFTNYFGCVVFDELHRLGSYHFSKVVGMFPARYRIGATATLIRSDGMSNIFFAHLGSNVIKQTISTQPKPSVYVVQFNKSSGEIPSYLTGKVHRRGKLISLLSENIRRSRMIANLAIQIAQSGRQTLVISEKIEQLKLFKELLKKDFKPEEIGLYIGKTSEEDREYIKKNCKIILATTSMLGLGTDIPTLRGLIFATPVSSIEQIVGRICRIKKGTKDPIVVDIVDTYYKVSSGWFSARMRYYNKNKYLVKYGR